MLSPPGTKRRATKLCPVLHEAGPPRDPSLYPPPRCRTATSRAFTWAGTRCPMPARDPACFRERIYISRNRLNFYTARRYGPENKTSAFLPIIGNEVAEAEASRREDKQSERERRGRKRKGRRVCSPVRACVDLSRQQRRIEKKKKRKRRAGRGCLRSFGTEVAVAIIVFKRI